VVGRHATGDAPGVGGASEIRGMRAEGERENGRGFEKGLSELSGKVLKTRVIY
jgi:hypothetical protein